MDKYLIKYKHYCARRITNSTYNTILTSATHRHFLQVHRSLNSFAAYNVTAFASVHP